VEPIIVPGKYEALFSMDGVEMKYNLLKVDDDTVCFQILKKSGEYLKYLEIAQEMIEKMADFRDK